MPQDLISVIITTYNPGEYIRHTIKAAIAQSWENKELILVDDGSNANFQELINSCITENPEIRLISQANAGLSSARNTGALAASGDYLAFLDHDDIWEEAYLSIIVKMLIPTNIGAAFCAIQHMTSSGKKLKRFSRPKLINHTIEDFLISDPIGCGSSFVVKKGAFESIGGFDKNLVRCETPDFFIRLLSFGWSVQGTSLPLVLYRNTQGSLSAGKEMATARYQVLMKTVKLHPEIRMLKIAMIWLRMHVNLLKMSFRKRISKD